ncbi:MAG TPA: Na+/H+ antiporter subunit E [Micromonospora sp.]|nr:Na+/H+ antiporter subunit E [Micromonospora sp.]
MRRRPLPTNVRPRNRWRDQFIALTWLVLVWNLLWGEFTWGNVIGGLIVALIVLFFFPLPPVTFGGRIRPVAVARFASRFFSDLVKASAQVSWLAFRPGPPPLSAVIAVPLRVRSDLNMTLVSEAVSLVPGSLIVEAEPHSGLLYVHVFGVRNIQEVEEFRREVLRLEGRIVRSIGSAAEVNQLTSEEGATT